MASMNLVMKQQNQKQLPPPGVQVFYIGELVTSLGRGEGRRGLVKDLGVLEPNVPLAIGMDKMVAKTFLGKYFVRFAGGSTLHGFNHLVASRRHLFERFLVGMIIFGALGGLIAISLDSWYRYQHESTMLVLDNNFRKFEIAKPSITICPINLLDEEKFPEVFRRIDEDFDEVVPSMWLRILYELRANVKVVSQYAEEFVWISTERGLCMMFANYVADYADIEYWIYGEVAKDGKIKRRKRSFFNINNYGVVGSISCKTHDFWMGVHYPDTIIDYTTPGKTVRKVTLNSLTLGITEVSSSKRVNSLSVRQRNCKLHKDAGLRMWPIYTRNMCKLECRYNAIRQLCGCLPHFAKPIKGVPICNAQQLYCIANHENDIVSSKTKGFKSCRCLEDCNEALYVDKESTSFALKEGSPSDAIINLNIDFPQVKYIHEEFFGFTDLLASVGGAAGLFLGASVLSFCEVIYFATLRLFLYYADCKSDGKKQRSLIAKRK